MPACISVSGNRELPDFSITEVAANFSSSRFYFYDDTENKAIWSTGVTCADMYGTRRPYARPAPHGGASPVASHYRGNTWSRYSWTGSNSPYGA